MSASTIITDYIGYGVAALRPVTPLTPTGCLAFWFATDTARLSVWDGSWQDIVGPATTDTLTNKQIISSLTGDPSAFSDVPPTFGGTWLTNHKFETTYSPAHSSDFRSTITFSRSSTGATGASGSGCADYTVIVTGQKSSYLSSGVEGEVGCLFSIGAQGNRGDLSNLLMGAYKVYGGVSPTGGAENTEGSVNWIDTSGNSLMNIHTIQGFAEGAGGQSGNTGYGFYTEFFGADHAVAASQINPWSAYYGGVYDANSNGAAHAPYFTNLLVGAGSRSSGDIYFKIGAGLTQTGDITIGSGNANGTDGNPTQSGGTRLTLKNVGGSLALYANNGTTKLLNVSQSGVATLNANAAALPSPLPSTVLQIGGADGTSPRLILDTFGGTPSFNGRRADGTNGSPTALQANDAIFFFAGFGYGATAYSTGRAAITFSADQNWSDTAHGTHMDMAVTVNNTTTNITRVRIQNSGGVTIGNTILSTDPGTDNLLVKGTIAAQGSFNLPSYTVGTLPTAGIAGRIVYASNCRVFNGAGVQDGSGSGTGGTVSDNGSAWKIAGTNVTAIA